MGPPLWCQVEGITSPGSTPPSHDFFFRLIKRMNHTHDNKQQPFVFQAPSSQQHVLLVATSPLHEFQHVLASSSGTEDIIFWYKQTFRKQINISFSFFLDFINGLYTGTV